MEFAATLLTVEKDLSLGNISTAIRAKSMSVKPYLHFQK